MKFYCQISSPLGRGGGGRENLKGHVLAVIGEGVLAYTGEELRTDDEDVWLQILHLAKEQPLSTAVEFTPYAMVAAAHADTHGETDS